MLNSVLLFYLLRRAQSDQDANHKQSCVWIFGIVVACAPVKEEPKSCHSTVLPTTTRYIRPAQYPILAQG